MPTPTTTGTTGTTGTTTTGLPPVTGTSSSLSEWAGPYVTNMLGQVEALTTNQPYSVYQGPLTAGTSQLQNTAFQGINALKTPASIGTAGTAAEQLANTAKNANPYSSNTFDTGLGSLQSVQGYMNPYTQNVTDIQLREARRQAEISQMADQAKLTQAGAYGGGRQAIMDAERSRNLHTQLNDITGTGLAQAYDTALKQRLGESTLNLDAAKSSEQSKQFGADIGQRNMDTQLSALKTQLAAGEAEHTFGLDNLKTQMDAGATQRDIESQGITADYDEFIRQRDWPLQQMQTRQSFLQGMPIAAQSNSYAEQDNLSQLLNSAEGLQRLWGLLAGIGNPATPATTPTTTPTN